MKALLLLSVPFLLFGGPAYQVTTSKPVGVKAEQKVVAELVGKWRVPEWMGEKDDTMDLSVSATGDVVSTFSHWDSKKNEFSSDDPVVWDVRQCGPNLFVFIPGEENALALMVFKEAAGTIEFFMADAPAFRRAIESGDARGRIVDQKPDFAGVVEGVDLFSVQVEPDQRLEALLSANDLAALFLLDEPADRWKRVENSQDAEPGVGADSR